ncbi:MAG: transcriptional activator NhaR [Planctomycetota bacterium]
MKRINYHHLQYFWAVAREGSVSAARELLKVAQPTISTQIRSLERSLGVKLFKKQGRKLVLTETGRVMYRYADEIFCLGEEMMNTLEGRPPGNPMRFVVGITDVVPKHIAYRLLRPVLHLDDPVKVICWEGKWDDLMGELAVNKLDLVLADVPIGPQTSIRAFNHLLGECGVSLVARSGLARKLKRGFPQSLDAMPCLLPTESASIRRDLERWFDTIPVKPNVLGEFEDSALTKVIGMSEDAFFVVPTAVEEEICTQYHVQLVGRVESVKERFYAISIERRIWHPAVRAISQAARDFLFA